MSNMQLFRKQKNTGMLRTKLSDGAEINGQLVKAGYHVIRPGNTVKCIPSELGVMGGRQFDALSPAPIPEQQAAKKAEPRPTVTLELRKQDKGSKWDVINPLNPDNPLNPEGLTKTKAQALLDQLLDQETSAEFENMNWDQLVDVLEREGGTVPDEAQDEADLIVAIKANRE